MKYIQYSFVRVLGINGLMSSNRASTDALKALELWRANSNRDYEVLKDEDDELVAEIKIDDNDSNAGVDLERYCVQFGVERALYQNEQA